MKRITQLSLMIVLMAGLVLASCSEDAQRPAPILWPQSSRGLLDAAVTGDGILARAPELLSPNAWIQDVTFDPDQDIAHNRLGYYPVGNGRAFAFLGSTHPQHALHGSIGPTYQTGDNMFFADLSVQAYKDGDNDALWFGRQTCFRVRHSGVVVTLARDEGAGLEMHTVTFSPRGEDRDPPVILQYVEVVNTGTVASPAVSLFVDSGETARVVDGQAVNSRDTHRRGHRFLGEDAQVGRESFMGRDGAFVHLGSIAPGAAAGRWMQVSFWMEDGQSPETLTATGVESMRNQTGQWWHAWFEGGMSLDTPDLMVNDLFDSFRYTIKVQQSAQGALVPMSHYSSVWIRDTFGPARFFSRIGHGQDARDMIEYYHRAAARRGDIGNSLDCDIEDDPQALEPDWLSMGAFSGRTRAEGPSHIPLMYKEYLDQGGDASLVQERAPYLMRALLGQGVTDEGLMYFSGDETYRPAMAVNMCLDASYAFEDMAYSANSAFIFVSAADFLLEFLSAHPVEAIDQDLVQELSRRRDAVFATLDGYYWLADLGRYSPFIYIDGLRPETRASIDVNTQPLWLGVQGLDPQKQRANLESCYAAAGKEDGLLQNQCPDNVELFGYDVGMGVYTGMSAGYWLYALKSAGLPLADTVFNTVRRLVSPSGNVPEDGIWGYYEALSPLYFASGGMGEVWARCRPWEGAIVADAMLYYLTGMTRTAEQAGTAFDPAFPNQWDRWCVNNALLDGRKMRACFSPRPGGNARVDWEEMP